MKMRESGYTRPSQSCQTLPKLCHGLPGLRFQSSIDMFLGRSSVLKHHAWRRRHAWWKTELAAPAGVITCCSDLHFRAQQFR